MAVRNPRTAAVTTPEAKVKYGKLPPKHHPKTLLLENFLSPAALPPPEEKRGWEWQAGIAPNDWGMLGNDMVGDCVIAMALHYLEMVTAIHGIPLTYTTQQALDLYSAITGYDPKQTDTSGFNPTDNGTAMTDLFAYWQKTGIYGHKIKAWASIKYTDPVKLNQAIDIFGAALVGINVAQSMEDQFQANLPLNAPFKGGSVGGHGIPIPGFGKYGRTCISYGQRWEMDLQAAQQIDEAYVVITPEWLSKASRTPLGMDMTALDSAIKAITA